MTATSRFYRALVFCLALVATSVRLEAQFGPLTGPGQAAQARSQDEFDSYLEIVSATDASVTVQKVKTFVSAYPKSELLGAVYQYQLHAFEQLNDFDGMLAAGEKALAADSDSLNALLALAPAMANRAAARPDRDRLLSQAESYARRALDGIDKVKIARERSMEDWNIRKHEMQSDAHGVIGVVAFQRGQLQPAINELEMAISLAPRPQGVQFLRLGLALAAVGKKDDAEQNLRRAAELGPDPVHNVALDQLKKLNEGQRTPR
jgi:tetratricopeptide (TPR) repeat protein